MEFRKLRAEEIMVRPTDTKFKGTATLLLYQDARCGMDILDETLGSERWQKEYYEVKGNVYCKVGIKTDSGEWIWKSDCGIESNVDAQKGEASDAFKRAVVNFGIGRELYSAPRIKIRCPEEYYYNEKLTMTFSVKEITYEANKISSLIIVDRFGSPVFVYDKGKVTASNQPTQAQPAQAKSKDEILKEFCASKKATEPKDKLLGFYNYYSTKTWNGPFNAEQLYSKWGTRN